MKMKPMNRRAILRGILSTGAAASVGLPLLDAMLDESGTALAQDGSPLAPKYVTWFFGNGTLPGLWKPSSVGSGADWALSPQLQPLAEFKEYLTVVSGLQGKLVVSGVEHPTGSAAATAGVPLQGNSVQGASVDQIIADVIGADSPFRSLEVGVTPATPGGNQDSLHTVSHNGPNSRNNPEFDPRAVFSRIFGGFESGREDEEGAEQAARVARARKSVLDAIISDGERLQKKLGVVDRQRLEQHLDAIRAAERRIQTSAGESPSACIVPSPTTVGPDQLSEAPPEVNAIMAELTTLALSCERTNVATFMFSLPAAHVYYRHLASDMNADFHDEICHTDPGDESNQPRVDAGVRYTMRCFGEFLGLLRDTPHGASNLLDAAFVYVTSDTAWGKVHDNREWPVLFAGKANGKLRGDEHHAFVGEDLSRALLTVVRAMGSDRSTLGSGAGLASEVLPGILV